MGSKTQIKIWSAIIALGGLAIWLWIASAYGISDNRYRYFSVVFPFLSSCAIGGTTVYIAYQQWRTNNLKLSFDMYQERKRIFDVLMEFLNRHTFDSEPTSAELVAEFRYKTRDAAFLFDKDITEYLDEIHKSAYELLKVETYLEDHHRDDHKALNAQRQRLVDYFVTQYKESKRKFARYMKLY